eukprot:m.37645 g.37645  ORF g.37645 m.37645 type:complete len:602 (-) comp11122_c0_seq1:211-2016(-)
MLDVTTLLCGAAVLVGLYVLVKLWLGRQKTSCLPRGYSTAKVVPAGSIKHTTPIHRDVYAKSKIPKDIDAIVIGSGIGGLTCAGFLSRAGKRVLVVEQHYIAGGSTHAFEEGKVEFDTGVHYIGNIEKRKKILDLITDKEIEWDQMGTKENGFLYDEIVVGDKRYDLKAGVDAFIEEMCKHFPDEREAIVKYVEMCKEVSKKDIFFNLKIVKPAWLARLLNKLVGKKFFDMTKRTALSVIQELTPNQELQAALLGQFGDYGRAPSVESFFVHASVANHYFEGGFYPKGGATEFAKQIIPVIERTGGRCLVQRAVESILINDQGVACGVVMDNGDKIRAPAVISGCGVFNTYQKLLPPHVVPKDVLKKIESIGPSCSMVYLFVGLEGTPDELKLRSSNIWSWPQGDYDAMLASFYADPLSAPIPMFIGFPCAKDSTWTTRFPGRSNSVILTMAKYEWFEEWESKKQGSRGEEYEAFKKQFETRILEEGLYKYYPQCRGKVNYTLVGSPLTFNHYIGSHAGEVYGMECSPERFDQADWLRAETKIPGLFLTGQDLTTLGVTGALMAGVLTAHAILGYGGIGDMASGRNLVEDVMHLEESKKSK